MRKPVWQVIILLWLMLLAACSERSENKTGSAPMTLRIGTLPRNNPLTMMKKYQPLMEYLGEKTGLITVLVIANSYSHLLELFETGKVDMASFGGVTYLKAYQTGKAKPLVMRDVDERFTSIVLVHKQASARGLQDLKNKSFVFGARLSTSGHLMPRHYFAQRGIDPEVYFKSITYSGAHDKTAYLIRDKKAYAGAANAGIIQQMYRDGRLKPSEVRVLWESPSFTDDVWAIQSQFPIAIQHKIRDAFLGLSVKNPQHKKILDNFSAGYYLPANHGQYAALEKIVASLSARGFLDDQD